MEPQSLSEQLMLSTILINTEQGRGTGFFYHFVYDNNVVVPVIITNKHVVNYKRTEKVSFAVHLKDNSNIVIGTTTIELEVEWIQHSNKDLCFCFANPIIEALKSQGKNIFYIAIDDSLIYDMTKLKKLSAVEDVLMVGYPIGMSDEINHYPIFRRGITASHPAIDFNQKGIGLVDMACFPGSSGSPIFIINEGSYSDKNGTVNIASRAIFLGVLYAGPTFNAQGKINVTEIPTSQIGITTPVMVNLGYYIKANELAEFRNFIEAMLKLKGLTQNFKELKDDKNTETA